jgi:uncharacterized membrane protein YedE/YeeE
MHVLASLVSGLLFGLGLAVSGLINPAKVQAFLDIAGDWDPSLALTMGAAVLVTAVGYRIVLAAGRPAFAPSFSLPPRADIDMRLIAGAAIFGIGWGLVGFCPGPAVAALSFGSPQVWMFVVAMLAGMVIGRILNSRHLLDAN